MNKFNMFSTAVCVLFLQLIYIVKKAAPTIFKKPRSVPQVKRNARETRRQIKEIRKVSYFFFTVLLIFIGKLTRSERFLPMYVLCSFHIVLYSSINARQENSTQPIPVKSC